VITVNQAMARWGVNHEKDDLQEKAACGGMGRVRDDGVFGGVGLAFNDYAVGRVRTGDQSLSGDGGGSGRDFHYGT
jgi:hypothetical protein